MSGLDALAELTARLVAIDSVNPDLVPGGDMKGPLAAIMLAAAGIPTVVYGPVTGDLHGEDEWVDLASPERCRAAYVEVARRICA